jgi:hypothetical protein
MDEEAKLGGDRTGDEEDGENGAEDDAEEDVDAADADETAASF